MDMRVQLDENQVVSLYRDGLSMQEIGDRLNVSRQPIDAILQRRGIQKRCSRYAARKYNCDET